MSINIPGVHWSELGEELSAQEFDTFKRTANFRLGSWLVRSLRDRKILYLARQLCLRGRIPRPHGRG